MDPEVRVAVVRGSNRRASVARALALLGDELIDCVRPDVLIKPNLVSHKYQVPSTHVDAIGATLDALFSAGARRVTIAEGASDAPAAFHRFGFQREAEKLPVRFFDLNRQEDRWEPLELSSVDGKPLIARVSRTITESSCRVSLALAKTHVTSIITLCLKNMLSSIHPEDRVMMHGYAGGGNGYQGWKRLAVDFLKRDNLAVNVLTRAMGRVKNARNRWLSLQERGDPFVSLTNAEMNYLRSVEAMNQNLAALVRKTRPHLAIVDGFVGMHREGPRHGTPIKLGTIIAGTDPVAVDAVAASIMGFDPWEIGYLVYAQRMGLGVIDLNRISIMGDPVATVRKRFVPHSNHNVQRHWHRLSELSRRGPHFALNPDAAGRRAGP